MTSPVSSVVITTQTIRTFVTTTTTTAATTTTTTTVVVATPTVATDMANESSFLRLCLEHGKRLFVVVE